MKRNLNVEESKANCKDPVLEIWCPAIDELVCTTRNCLAVRETADLDGAYE